MSGLPKHRIICQGLYRPGEPWPYCMCQKRSLPGEDYCATHMPASAPILPQFDPSSAGQDLGDSGVGQARRLGDGAER